MVHITQSAGLTPIDFTIGLPPSNLEPNTNIVMENSMPMVRIYPGIPTFTKGLALFTRESAFTKGTKKNPSYTSLLADHGFVLKQPGQNGCLTIAYQADSFPTDSFTNEYGENWLQSVTSTSSSAIAAMKQASQLIGGRDLGDVFSRATGAIKKEGKIGSMIGGGMESAAKSAKNLLGAILPKSVTGGLDVASSLMADARIDFPMMWKSSSFSPSYTMTIRLYNPNPASEASTKKYIAGPIAALMLLGIPISQDGMTYSWPFIHRIWSPGIYDLDPAFISNITIIKGGDQQQIAFNQRLGIVDVRIDFGSLFSSMLASKKLRKTRPSLQKYIDGIAGPSAVKSGVLNFSSVGQTEEEKQLIQAEQRAAVRGIDGSTKNQAPTRQELTTEEKQNPPSRVGSVLKDAANSLIAKIPTDFKISID